MPKRKDLLVELQRLGRLQGERGNFFLCVCKFHILEMVLVSLTIFLLLTKLRYFGLSLVLLWEKKYQIFLFVSVLKILICTAIS